MVEQEQNMAQQQEQAAPRERDVVPDDPLAKDLWAFATKQMGGSTCKCH